MMRGAVKDIVEAHCKKLSAAQKRRMAEVLHDASPRRVLLTPPIDELLRHVRGKLALDNNDVAGSIGRIGDTGAALHSAGPLAPHRSGLGCAARVVASMPDIAPVVRDVVLMTDIPSVVRFVYGACANPDPDPLLARAAAAWRARDGGLRRLLLDTQVLMRYTGNDAECAAVLASILRNRAYACDAYAGSLAGLGPLA
jgi:hypothetical protein